MPYLKIQTNVPLDGIDGKNVLKILSQGIATALAKSERYVMVSLEMNPDMLFAADDSPMAYLELKSIGLPEDQTAGLSQLLAQLLQEQLGIAPDRVYIEFVNVARTMWGWNGSTF